MNQIVRTVIIEALQLAVDTQNWEKVQVLAGELIEKKSSDPHYRHTPPSLKDSIDLTSALSTGPKTVRELGEALFGRYDKNVRYKVHNKINYMKKKGQIRRMKTGKWALVK